MNTFKKLSILAIIMILGTSAGYCSDDEVNTGTTNNSGNAPTSPKSPPRNLRDDVGHPNFDALIDFSVTAKAALKQFCEVHTTLCEEGLTEYPDALHQLVNGACYNLEQKLGGTPLITSKHFRRIEGSLADLAKKLQAATIQGNTAQQQADILMVWVAAQS